MSWDGNVTMSVKIRFGIPITRYANAFLFESQIWAHCKIITIGLWMKGNGEVLISFSIVIGKITTAIIYKVAFKISIWKEKKNWIPVEIYAFKYFSYWNSYPFLNAVQSEVHPFCKAHNRQNAKNLSKEECPLNSMTIHKYVIIFFCRTDESH